MKHENMLIKMRRKAVGWWEKKTERFLPVVVVKKITRETSYDKEEESLFVKRGFAITVNRRTTFYVMGFSGRVIRPCDELNLLITTKIHPDDEV